MARINRATCSGSSSWTKCRAPGIRNSSDPGKNSWKPTDQNIDQHIESGWKPDSAAAKTSVDEDEIFNRLINSKSGLIKATPLNFVYLRDSSAKRRNVSAVALSAGKKDSRASSAKVISTGIPNTVVVLKKLRTPSSAASFSGTTAPAYSSGLGVLFATCLGTR
jgi:hypothetical protein